MWEFYYNVIIGIFLILVISIIASGKKSNWVPPIIKLIIDDKRNLK